MLESYNATLKSLLKNRDEFNREDVIQVMSPLSKELFNEDFDKNNFSNFIEGNKQAIRIQLEEMQKTKVFSISEELKKLFLMTDNKTYKRDVPFDNFFLDVELDLGDIKVHGINVIRDETGCIARFKFDIIKDSHNIAARLVNSRQHNAIVDLFTYDETKMEDYRGQLLNVNPVMAILRPYKDREEIKKFVCNFLDFLNHPEVSTRIVKWDSNQARIKRGKNPIPDQVRINVTGKLYRYIRDNLQEAGSDKLDFSFWVRGHYIHFWNKEIYKRIYSIGEGELAKEGYYKDKNNVVCKWILPYIKGKGEVINKNYGIGQFKIWENQNILESYLRELFYNFKVYKNVRTVLDGLEIDCYIPELKLGFEYNGEQHYKWVKEFHKTEEEFKAQQERDVKKNQLAKEKGIRLITIKYDEKLSKDLIISKIKEENNGATAN